MNEIKIYKVSPKAANIEQTKMNRDWLEDLPDRHGYKCFPMALANTLGWTLSFNEDIEFEWDGITDTTPNHLAIYKGESIANPNRGSATISFDSSLIFKTDENTSILSIAVPNYWRDGIQPYTSIISTSFFKFPLPIAWRITKPNHRFVIKAGEPIITVIPISVKGLMDYEVNLYDIEDKPQWLEYAKDYGKAVGDMNKKGFFSNFYRNATDHLGSALGKHEAQAIKLKTFDHTKKD